MKDGARTPNEITAHSRAEIRALLTPDQQKKFNEDLHPKPPVATAAANAPRQVLTNGGSFTPTGDPSFDRNQAVRAYIASHLEHSPSIAARVGTVIKVRPAGGQSRTEGISTPDAFSSGSFIFIVDGSERSETVKVSWEKSAKEPFKIVRIEVKGGTVIPL